MIEAAKTVIADIETTAITYGVGGKMIYPTKVHLIIAYDYERQLMHVFGPGEDSLKEGVDFLQRSETVVFHNGIGFDVPVLELLYGLKRRHDKHFIDSLVLCQLFYSNVKEEEDFKLYDKSEKLPDGHPHKFPGKLLGSHSLEAWGLRLRHPVPKGDYGKSKKGSELIPNFDPWASWSQEMQDYAIQDVVTLSAIWTERLRDKFYMTANQQAISVEHYLAELMEQLKQTGIKLDIAHAEKLCEELEAKSVELENVIAAEFPPRYEPVKWVYNEVPLGFPALTREQRIQFDVANKARSPEGEAICETLLSSGPQQQLSYLMYQNQDNSTYRPRFNLPDGYIREWYGEETLPKVSRVFYEGNRKDSGVVLYSTTKGDPFVKIAMRPLNPRSRTQIVRRLLEFGWVPEEFTESGNPSVSEVELHKIEEQFPAAASLAKYLLIQKRLGQIKTGDKAWLKLVDEDGFLHPTIRACNTVAFRASHSDPNVSQVPSVRMKDMLDDNGKAVLNEKGKVIQRIAKGEEGKWGWECRACFTVPEGFVMVGSDLAGIELRAWAHYLTPFDNGYFADVVLNKDVHEENRIILGFDNRRKAKEWLYACVPMDTECLTRRGWRTYDELILGEEVLTYNSDKELQEWQPLLEKVYYADAPIMRMSDGQGFVVDSTPNHRWFLTDGSAKTTEQLTSRDQIVSQMYQGDIIPVVIKKRQWVNNTSVWCPRTANGSWVMRQGDTITITGNTLYGAGDEKLGFIIDPQAPVTRQKALGAASRARFMQGLRGYEQLNEQLMLGVRRGHLKGLDGRRVPIRKQHAALNALLQSAGAIISKYWIVFVLDILENEMGLQYGYDKDFTLLIFSHDELDFAVRAGLEHKVADACARAALKAGQHLDFRLPVDVGTMIGGHWGECH